MEKEKEPIDSLTLKGIWAAIKSIYKKNFDKNTKKLLRSNYGRNFGWYVELDGEIIAELIDCQWEEMFWDSYLIVPYSEEKAPLVFNKDMWLDCRFKFRNREFLKLAASAFCGWLEQDLCAGDRIMMRALYLTEV